MYRVLILLCFLTVTCWASGQAIQQEQISAKDKAIDILISGPLEPDQEAERSKRNQDADEEAEQYDKSGVCPEDCGIAARDLDQQTKMAVGTESLAVDSKTQIGFTKWALIINAVGLCVLFLALFLNWSSTVAAVRSANAAQTALKKDRAYLTFMPHNPKELQRPVFDSAGNLISQTINLNWINNGASPAINTKLCVEKKFSQVVRQFLISSLLK